MTTVIDTGGLPVDNGDDGVHTPRGGNGASRANLSNWRKSPFNRWAFNHVREIVPSVDIANLPASVWQMPFAPLLLDQFRLKSSDGSSMELKSFLQGTATDSLVILHNGRIVYEFYDNGNTQHTPHILMSATKSVVGLLVGILNRNGNIDVDAPVSTYVPEIAGTAYQGATIQQLLDMQTGIVLDAGHLRAYAQASNWDPPQVGAAATDLHSFFAQMTIEHRPHGGPFRYVSANTDLLGWAIERSTGQSFASLVSQLIWIPMGAENSAYITVDRQGAPRCTGGLCATARDFARLGQLLLQAGRRDLGEVFPHDWISDIADNGDPQAWQQGEFAAAFGRASMSYRNGWYVAHTQPKLLFAMGIHGQNLFVDKTNGIVIAKLSSQHDPIDHQALPLTHRGVAELRRCLLA
jgi:CubicO group peptidase (beta-lactamase class C family)